MCKSYTIGKVQMPYHRPITSMERLITISILRRDAHPVRRHVSRSLSSTDPPFATFAKFVTVFFSDFRRQ